MNTHEIVPEAGLVTAGLDYYKPTMSQFEYKELSGVTATFTFKNRGEQRLEEFVPVDELQDRLNGFQERGWQKSELDFLAEQRDHKGRHVFSASFLDSLRTRQLPDVVVSHNLETNDLAIQTGGEASLVTFWETIIMSDVNELYFENYVKANGLDLNAIYDEGDRRLSQKIATLQAHPDIKFADFGTRRRFSLRWQRHVVERLKAECPNNLIGTSNVALANSLDLKPIGTFAHELPMMYAGLADAVQGDIRSSHRSFLEGWFDRYGEDLSIALTDTFGSEFFFDDFTPEQTENWRGLRHDSGDPIEFGERTIAFYEANNIDPTTKTIVFSDGLDMDEIMRLHEHFNGRINAIFGWGTTLTNDLGIKALNIVAKVTHVRTWLGQEADTVKLSDNAGKHCGPEEKVKEYQHVFGKIAVRG
jgi:nicotinate phosphoribosyltransferase